MASLTLPETAHKNLVLGLAKRYNFEQIKPFLASLRNSGFTGDICLLMSDLSLETQGLIQAYDVQLIPFPEIHLKLPLKKPFDAIYPHHLLQRLPIFSQVIPKLLDQLTFKTGEKQKLIQSGWMQFLLDMCCARFLTYYSYLKQQNQVYQNILLTDVRDVLFQRDPFDFDINNHLCCFLEDSHQTLGSCPINSAWMTQAFGTQILDKLGHQTISCAGVTIGSYSAVMNYLELMIDYLIPLGLRVKSIDQGIHNYLIYTGLIPDLQLFANQQGPVLTMGYLPDKELQFDQDGWLVNQDGSVVHILHQYDRHSQEVQAKLLAKVMA